MSRLRRASLLIAVATAVSATPASAEEELSARLDALSSNALIDDSPSEQARAVSLLAHGPGSLMRDGDSLVVDIRVHGDVRDRVAGIRAAGGDIVATSPGDGLIEAAVPESSLRDVGDAAGVDAVTEVLTPLTGAVRAGAPNRVDTINTCATGTVSEGVAQLKAGIARTQFDADGTGVKVGVLSDSYDRKTTASTHAADDVASGDLPGVGNPCGRTAPVQVLDDSAPDIPSPPTVGDEGRAMAQIVHDVAPGADLAFATASTGDVAFANNIKALANAGADVIADDIIYFDEPFFQDGIIANAVTTVTDQGVAYFSMAFNDNRVIGGNDSNSWEAPAYRSMACPPLLNGPVPAATDCMDFDPGAGTDGSFNITATGQAGATRPFRFILQWAQPQNGVTTDFDLYLLNTATSQLFSSTNVNATTGKPYEFIGLNPGNTTAGNYQLFIRRTSGTGTPRLKWVNADNSAGSIAGLEYPTSSNGDIVGPTIFGHNGTAAAQTVGAVPFNNSATMESYSSRGPVTHYFAPANGSTPAAALASPEVLSKPNVSATDGGLNTFFGSGNRFFGTSAATPHAAGVAALQLSANPALTPAQIKATQMSTADPIGGFGPLAAGAGLVNALDALGGAPPAPPTVAITSRPAARTNVALPTFAFGTTGNAKTLSCIVDGTPIPCASPFTVPAALADGPHAVTVSATDYFGQSGEASATFDVDTTGPGVSIKKGPKAKTNKKKAKFVFTAGAGTTLHCKLDKGAFEDCAAREKFKVKPGNHKLEVFATDDLGNAGARAAESWKVKKKRKKK